MVRCERTAAAGICRAQRSRNTVAGQMEMVYTGAASCCLRRQREPGPLPPYGPPTQIMRLPHRGCRAAIPATCGDDPGYIEHAGDADQPPD